MSWSGSMCQAINSITHSECLNPQGPEVPPSPPGAIEARVATGTRRHPTTGPADAAPDVLARASGVIWDFFYVP